MAIVFWIGVFIVSLALLIKGADWLLESAEKIGLFFGWSPFIIGVVIVGLGTSFPELIAAFAAVLRGVTDIVPANAIGASITNILFVIGLSAIVARRIIVTSNLVDLDLPLLAASTVLLVGTAYDGTITQVESLLLVASYALYLAYNIFGKREEEIEEIAERIDILPSRHERRKLIIHPHRVKKDMERPEVRLKTVWVMLFGILGLVVGGKYLITAVIALSDLFHVGTGTIALVAVSLGTTLPELSVSIKAAYKRKSEIVLGNIFGSNVFNLLSVIGIPGLFVPLTVGPQTLSLGIPILLAATFLFIISAISGRIHMWEGAMFIALYVFFVGKVFGFL